jgi:DNA-binding Lrp family transcriptional regulator
MIQDIIEEVKRVNQMIDFHSTNKDSDFMLKQYQSKRDQLISELEYELEKLNDFDNWKAWKNQ